MPLHGKANTATISSIGGKAPQPIPSAIKFLAAGPPTAIVLDGATIAAGHKLSNDRSARSLEPRSGRTPARTSNRKLLELSVGNTEGLRFELTAPREMRQGRVFQSWRLDGSFDREQRAKT